MLRLAGNARRIALPSILAALALTAAAAEPVYHPGTTRKIRQVTGETDTPLRRPTLSLTRSRYGVISTDLGSSFEHKGHLYFLFGDTVGKLSR